MATPGVFSVSEKRIIMNLGKAILGAALSTAIHSQQVTTHPSPPITPNPNITQQIVYKEYCQVTTTSFNNGVKTVTISMLPHKCQ
jgi:hypothetical protein